MTIPRGIVESVYARNNNIDDEQSLIVCDIVAWYGTTLLVLVSKSHLKARMCRSCYEECDEQ